MKIFSRLLTFLRPYRTGVVWSFVLAALAMAATVAIPYLTGRAIDAVRKDGDRRPRPAALRSGSSLVAGVVRLGLSVARRLVAGRVSLGVELDLRNRLYEHLQRSSSGSSTASRRAS